MFEEIGHSHKLIHILYRPIKEICTVGASRPNLPFEPVKCVYSYEVISAPSNI